MKLKLIIKFKNHKVKIMSLNLNNLNKILLSMFILTIIIIQKLKFSLK